MSLASIPSPADGDLQLGPLSLHAYGLMLAIGVLAAVWLAQRRYEARGGAPGTIPQIAVVVVISGVIGARIYHLFTGYDWDADGIAGTIRIWEGGLSIWGAVIGGVLGVAYEARRHHLAVLPLLDAIAPGLVLAQAIGRWGNWFNQELFGRPTTLPWGLEIDLAHRPPGYEQYATFHPTFLYESIWCLAVMGVLLAVERRLRTGQVFALYVVLYTAGRTVFEAMRIDSASELFGVRFNLLVSIGAFLGGIIWFVVLGRRSPRVAADDDAPAPESAAPSEHTA